MSEVSILGKRCTMTKQGLELGTGRLGGEHYSPHDSNRGSPNRDYFIVMVLLQKTHRGQFLTLLGSAEDLDLEEVRPPTAPYAPAMLQATCPSVLEAHPGHLAAPEEPGSTSMLASQSCPKSSVLGTRSNTMSLTAKAWSLATDTSFLCLLCCRRVSL